MLIVHVHVRVKPASVADLRQVTIENARSTVQEPGIARFDVVEQQDDPPRFVLNEVYRSPEAAATHKETAHYVKWCDNVADMIAEPRRRLGAGKRRIVCAAWIRGTAWRPRKAPHRALYAARLPYGVAYRTVGRNH